MAQINFPKVIRTVVSHGGHIQGIAVDEKNSCIYCSFTTELVKLDLQGNFIGSVRGFTGHLGCIALCPEDGRIYGSLEYKNDAIGASILNRLGVEQVKNAFYIAIFDGSRITRADMDMEQEDLMTTVWLREVTEDYLAQWEENGAAVKHRFGCSGIDGITFAPAFDGEGLCLLVAYGIYDDVTREDNDFQHILSYSLSQLRPFEAHLSADNIHSSGPESCGQRYVVYTGNTEYGVQNMEYDPYTGDIFLAVYPGQKEKFPNFPMFVIDGSKKPADRDDGTKELFLKEAGLLEKGIYGYRFPYGSTGLAALGDGLFYVSHESSAPSESQSGWYSDIRLYRYTGAPDGPFEEV